MSSTMSTRSGAEELNRARIAAEALALVDADGLGALSMRRLAERLGVGTMTLYGHVRSKDDLYDAIVDAAASEVGPARAEGTWQERLRAVARALREGLAGHPELVQLRLRRPILTPAALRWTEVGFDALLEAGFEAAEAAAAFRALFLYSFGFAAFEHGQDAQVQARTRAALASLPPEEFPRLSAEYRHITSAAGADAQFELALDLLIAGMEARLAG